MPCRTVSVSGDPGSESFPGGFEVSPDPRALIKYRPEHDPAVSAAVTECPAVSSEPELASNRSVADTAGKAKATTVTAAQQAASAASIRRPGRLLPPSPVRRVKSLERQRVPCLITPPSLPAPEDHHRQWAFFHKTHTDGRRLTIEQLTPEHAHPARRMGTAGVLHPHRLRHLPPQHAALRYPLDKPARSLIDL